MNQKTPDYLMIFFSILTMIMTAAVGIALLSSCSANFHRESIHTEGMPNTKTDFSLQTKI